MKKILSLVLTTVLLLSVITGCGNKAADSTNTSGDSGGPVTLRFSWWGGDERRDATLAVIAQYEKEHPNVTIEPEYGSSDGYSDRLSTQLAAGTAPDIIQIDPAFMPSLVTANANYFINYNDFGFDFSNFDPNYYTQRINGFYDGKQLGIPTGLSGCMLLVNQDLATKFSVDFSKAYTFDDLLTWGKKVHDTDSSIFMLEMNKDVIAKMFVNNYLKQLTGLTFFDETKKTLNYSEAQLTQAYTYVKSLYDNNVVAPASYMAAYSGDTIQTDPNWIKGKYVASYTYLSTGPVLRAANPTAKYSAGKFAIMSNAKIDGWNANTPQVIAVNAKSKNSKEAVKFVDYFFNNSDSMTTLGITRSIPSTAKARGIAAANGKLDSVISQAGDISSSYKGLVDDKYYSSPEAMQIIIDQVEAVGYGASTPSTAAKDTVKLLEKYISAK